MVNDTATTVLTTLASSSAVANAFSTIASTTSNTTDDNANSGYVDFIDSWYSKLIAGLCTFAAIGRSHHNPSPFSP